MLLEQRGLGDRALRRGVDKYVEVAKGEGEPMRPLLSIDALALHRGVPDEVRKGER